MKVDKYSRLLERRDDQEFLLKSFSLTSAQRILNESYKQIDYPETIKYIIGSMKEMDSSYTENSYNEGERVKNHLENLSNEVTFKYQGSVTNNTHIKAHSDIDLLVIIEKFITLEPPLKPNNPYQGNPNNDLLELRKECKNIFISVYTAVDIDDSGSSAISLSGGSLKRKIDVVPSNWFETVKYQETNQHYYRGIQVLDKKRMQRNKNFPFLNNHLIDLKDQTCRSNFRKAVRLLKNIKADADKDIDISSYDIVAILFHMDDYKYNIEYYPINILLNIEDHFNNLIRNPYTFESLKVPDNSRKIAEKVSSQDLIDMRNEITDLKTQAIEELSKLGKKLDSVYIST